MKTFTTKAGTELPLRDMKGKDYLDVCWRVLWMREEHPDWSIQTEFLTLSPDVAVAHATIKDETGRVLAQGTKEETPLSFKLGFIEKAETGAIGRALGFAGYGTQFALDLDDSDENGNENPVVADAPIDPKKTSAPAAPSELGAYVIKVGKHKGKRLSEVGQHDLNGWVQSWDGKTINGPLKDGVDSAARYLDSVERKQSK